MAGFKTRAGRSIPGTTGITTLVSAVLLTVLTLPGMMACGDLSKAKPDAAPVQRMPLPPALREVSGLAALDNHRLLTVTDELAIVHAIDTETGAVEELLSLGDPVIAADFEGIAVAGMDVWLVTSRGVLYRAINGLNGGKKLPFEVFSTGLEDSCEVEGLAFDSTRFLLVCKKNFRTKLRNKLVIHAWTPGDTRAQVYLIKDLKLPRSLKALNPSGIAVDGDSLHIVAARQRLQLTIDREGNLLGSRALHGHRQAEGVAVLPDGSIAIADEGRKSGGFITRYRPDGEAD